MLEVGESGTRPCHCGGKKPFKPDNLPEVDMCAECWYTRCSCYYW